MKGLSKKHAWCMVATPPPFVRFHSHFRCWRCTVAGKVGFHCVVLGIFQRNQYSAKNGGRVPLGKGAVHLKNHHGCHGGCTPLFQGFSVSLQLNFHLRLIAIENWVSHTCDLIFHNDTC